MALLSITETRILGKPTRPRHNRSNKHTSVLTLVTQQSLGKSPTYGKHWGDKLLGTLDYESGEIPCRHATQYAAMEFPLDRLAGPD